ncbi:hypothetical protein ASG67_12470 [Sphingomonas sp. Leaf339]|uniref:hypothetical protein n=1 Tax=Sphingomonas sp. Leaf339 TaxID=1736343 RepID=UPI0006F44C63|nr:hypothetical protein [Sphingomonas sp. Leaf339]KQU48148.1 hypothetical protein ASG67_12470 [Sphingomonas sp. Leaf339]
MRHDSSGWTGRHASEGLLARGKPVIARRRWVRWVLIGCIIAAAGMTVADIAFSPTGALLPDSFWLFTLLLFGGQGFSPFARSSFSTPDKGGLDEFERSTVEWATLLSYRTIMALIVAGCGYGWMATYRGWPLPTQPADWAALGMGLLVIATNLPACIAEFAIPMPADAEEDTP